MESKALTKNGFIRNIMSDHEKKVNSFVILVALVILIIISFTVSNFFNKNNIINIFEQVSSIGFFSLGLTLVLVTGGIDLSVPGVIMAASCVGGSYMINGGNWVVAVFMMIGVGLIFGLINAVAIAKGKMVPFIVTLSTLVLSRGIAEYFSASQTIYGFPESFLKINTRLGYVPISIIFFLVIAAIISVVLTRTIYGRKLFMVGENIAAAKVCGFNTDSILFSAYFLSGILAGIGSVFLTARLGSSTATMVGDTVTNDTIAACIIGGASLFGGKGSILGSVLGLIFITIVGNCFNLLGISYYVGMIIKGVIVALVIYIDVIRPRR